MDVAPSGIVIVSNAYGALIMRQAWKHLVLAACVVGVVNLNRAIAQENPVVQNEPQRAPLPQPQQQDVPVRGVVLFSSGVGYFDHFGTVQGGGEAELKFKTAQINDVLKSLVLQDLDGGKVGTVTYASQDPLSKTLKSFQVDVSGNPPLADLLNQLRGAKVTVDRPGEKVEGTIVGVERRKKQIEGSKETVETAVITLISGGKLVTFPLDGVSGIELADPQLQDELNRALMAVASARDQDKKPVTIHFTGEGARRVRVGYVVETPVWKTSYRLVMGGDAKIADAAKPQAGEAGKGTEKAMLQGWAIVENQTDNDWDNVQLSLVSGRPISFVMDLYQPLYVPRPVVQQELYASLRPQDYGAGMEVAKEAVAFGVAGGGVLMEAKQLGRVRPRTMATPASAEMAYHANDSIMLPVDGAMDITSSVASAASASKLGDLFQYTVGNVSLPRQSSAMIPIVTDPVEVERLSIYNASVLPRNPLNGARVKNTTDKHLLQGPVTVFDANSYAGDAKIDNLPPGQERLLSYGIDLKMLVDSTKNTHENRVVSGKLVKGVLQLQRKLVATQEYLADNKGETDKTLIVEHPIRQGWKLSSTEKPIETTDALYRFKGKVEAGKASKLVVSEEFVQSETIAILPLDIESVVAYAQTGEMNKDVKTALLRAAELKRALETTEQQIQQKLEQLNQITQEQNRIRENLKSVQQNSAYYNRLMQKLNDQESNIETLQKENDDLTSQRDRQQKELEAFVVGMNVG